MASISDIYAPGAGHNALGGSYANGLGGLTSTYGLGRNPIYQQEDAATAMTRLGRGFDRNLFHLNSGGAAKGQWGSSGLAMRGDELNQDTQDKMFDVQTGLARNIADVSKQSVGMFMGLY